MITGCVNMYKNIEELLNLFNDEEVRKIILSSYFLSQEKNIELSNEVFQRLLFLKLTNPSISIKINKTLASTSNYNYFDNTIYLNGGFDEVTFFHELTHLFSRTCFNFDIPQEYNDFKNNFLSSKNNHSLLFSFIKLCKEEKKKNFERLGSRYSLKNSNNKNNESIASNASFPIELSIISHLEDIVDAIVGGESRDLGLHYEISENYIIQKNATSAGHGCEYFAIPGNEFEEIIANYQSINLIDPNNELFNILKLILGSEFISFLDNRCQIMNGRKIELENNNNIHK